MRERERKKKKKERKKDFRTINHAHCASQANFDQSPSASAVEGTDQMFETVGSLQ